MNIVFGVKNLVKTNERTGAYQKYPELAVVTIEGKKEKGKSRRILFNKKASEALSLEGGSNEHIIFAPIHDSGMLLIANLATVNGGTGDMTSYKTSKNEVTYSIADDQVKAEKGKGILSSHMCNEIFSFMGLDDSSDIEFMLSPFESDQVDAFSFEPVSLDANEVDVIEEEVVVYEELALSPNGNAIETGNDVEFPTKHTDEETANEVVEEDNSFATLQRSESYS